MDTKNVYLRLAFLALFGVLVAALLGSCGYCPPQVSEICGLIPDAPFTVLTTEDRNVVFEEPGTIIV